MKKTILFVLLVVCIFVIGMTFAGCLSKGNIQTPQNAIENAYGDSEFEISFMAKGLSMPLKSISYSASNMPKLPTPQKVGYIFTGWFLDPEYTIPYVDGILYLYMRDITLYAKWEKESFIHNGIYDIEYSAIVLEDTIVKAAQTDEFGGYLNFVDSLLSEGIYLEKTEGKLLLKLQYDSKFTLPMFSSLGPVYAVNISPKMDTSVYIDSRIDSAADPIKTIFINLTNFDFEDTLYLDIQTTNWFKSDLSDAQRIATLTKYTIEFKFTKIIGFASSYVNTDVPLDEGYYLVKSYYFQENTTETMAGSFNPVYSYLHSDGNENYTLIKQSIPYAGLVSTAAVSQEEKKNSYYYHRMMSFMPICLFYELTNPPTVLGGEKIEYDYYPEGYGGGNYGNCAMEYHADTGNFYSIFELGSNLKSSYMVMGAVTGFMEVMSAMGHNNFILKIDYDQMIKLASVDYKPLKGDSYQYHQKMQYYPGNPKDLVERNLCYDLMLENGLSTNIVNFFFSTQDITMPIASRTQYSSRIDITPTVGTNVNAVETSRYLMAYFDVNTKVYGYDYSLADKLYADVITLQSLHSNGMRRNIEINTGKSCTIGESIKLSDIYADKVDAKNSFSTVNWTVYGMSNGSVNYDDIKSFENEMFIFAENVAVLFENKKEDGTMYALVELVAYEEPNVTVMNTLDYPYNPDASYLEGETISYPYLRYSWMGNKAKMIDVFYPSGLEAEDSINTVKVAVFTEKDGKYWGLEYGGYNQTTFVIPSEKFIIVYELNNKYGERCYHKIPFVCSSKLDLFIIDSNDEIIYEKPVRYTEKGERVKVVCMPDSERLTIDNYNAKLNRFYRLKIGDFEKNFELVEYTLYTDTLSEEEILVTAELNPFATTIWEKINGSSYAVLKLIYMFGSDIITYTYYYNLNFGGSFTPTLLTYDDYFVDYEYSFALPALYDSQGNFVSNGFAYCRSNYNYVSFRKDLNQYRFVVKQAGEHIIVYSYTLNLIRLTLSQPIYVWNNNIDVSITYKTDVAHPFNDGTFEKTVIYNLAQDIYSLKKNEFSSTIPASDSLYGWSIDEGSYKCKIRSGVLFENFVSEFNSRNITLYAIWDPMLVLTINKGDGSSYNKAYYLNNYGYYSLRDSELIATAPSGYRHLGWESLLWRGIVNHMTYSIRPETIDWNNPDSFIINPVFKKEITVRYSVDSTYTNEFFRNEKVLEGGYVTIIANKMTLISKVEGYKFAGWYVSGDETQTLIDFETYMITEEVTFVTKFIPV